MLFNKYLYIVENSIQLILPSCSHSQPRACYIQSARARPTAFGFALLLISVPQVITVGIAWLRHAKVLVGVDRRDPSARCALQVALLD